MTNNLYGGYLYEQTPFIFDKIYPNYHDMIIDENPPLIGRFVLVKYSKFAFSQDMINLMAHYVVNYQYPDYQPEQNEYYPTTNEEEEWCNNYEVDYEALIENTENPPSAIALIPYDRKIYQIVWDNANSKYSYMEIGCLTSTLSAEGISNLIEENKTYTNLKTTEAIDYTDGQVSAVISDTDNWIKAETARAEAVEEDHEERIATMELFWESADKSDKAIDTLQELQEYINSDTTGAVTMAGNIQANASAIEDLWEVVGYGGELEIRVVATEDRLGTIEGTGAGSIKKAVTDAVTEVKAYTDTAEADAKAYTDGKVAILNSTDSRLETAISNEITARTNADNAISAKIGGSFNNTNTVAKAISDAQTNAEANAATTAQGKVDALANGQVKTNTDTLTAIQQMLTWQKFTK